MYFQRYVLKALSFSSPKIQRLVTPLRLQRRRHLHSVKRRRLEHQKEQKAEYEYVYLINRLYTIGTYLPPVLCLPSVLLRRRKRLLPSRRHTRSAYLFNDLFLLNFTHFVSIFQDCVISLIISRLYLNFLSLPLSKSRGMYLAGGCRDFSLHTWSHMFSLFTMSYGLLCTIIS